MSTELKHTVLAATLMFGVGLHGAAREVGPDSVYGYLIAALALALVVIGLYGKE